MSLRILIGRAGSGKTGCCLNEITEHLKKAPNGSPLLYIVPEQAAFQAEFNLAILPGLNGIIRAQALSFKRLAWKIMLETGGRSRLFIDDSGKSMVFRKIMEKHQSRFKIFQNASEQRGVLDNLVQFFNERKRSCVTLNEMAAVKEKLNESPLLVQKIEELIILMGEAENELEKKYLDSEDYLKLLAGSIHKSTSLKDARVWIDGFYGFTNLELEVLEQLIKNLPAVTVALTLDKDYSPKDDIAELNPFYPTATVCQQLQSIAWKHNIEVKKELFPSPGFSRFENNSPLYYLEQHLNTYPVKPYSDDSCLPVNLIAAADRRQEIEAAARKISKLARSGYRYRDIAVIVSSMEQYEDYISTVFQDYDIPYFLDQKRDLTHHPLVEFIRSALEVVTRNWTYEAVFRCLKTDFLLDYGLSAEGCKDVDLKNKVDKLENYVLALGIQGQHLWLREEPWFFSLSDDLEEEKDSSMKKEEKEFLQQINEVRRIITAPLKIFQDYLQAAATVEEKTRAVFYLLNEAHVYEQLQRWSEEANLAGDAEKAREHLQAYKSVIDVLDQVVEIMGEEKVSTDFYADVMETGLENLRLSMVPPSLDQVEVGDFQRSRCENVKYTFFVGLNEGLLPSKPQKNVIFTEKEKETLLDQDMEVSTSDRRELLDQQFLIYMALTRAYEGLFLSYSMSDEEGRTILPSLLVHRIKEIFPSLEEELFPLNSVATGREEDTAEIINSLLHPREALSRLLFNLKKWKNGEHVHPLWWDVYNWFCSNEEWKEQARRAINGVFYNNRELPLSRNTSRKLYGQNIQTSITALEKYNACPFSHFVAYGLRLQERERYTLKIPDIGRFFHVILRNLTRSLMEEGRDFSDLSSSECYGLTAQEVERLLPRVQGEILLSSRRYRFIAEKIKTVVGQAVQFLSFQSQKTEFTPIEAELTFSKNGQLPPLAVDLGSGNTLQLVGRIDRVDGARDEKNTLYTRIVDYKSGRTNLKLGDIYYGLSLQMLAYQEAVLYWSNYWLGERVKPAGLLYFQVHSPIINGNKVLSSEEIQNELSKHYKMRGLVLADFNAVYLMDNTLSSGYSQVIPVGLSNKGTFYKNSSVLQEDKFELVRSYFWNFVQNCGRGISAGNVDISPYRSGSRKACRFCEALEVCQFDPLFQGNSYRLLKSGRVEEVLSWMEDYVQHITDNLSPNI